MGKLERIELKAHRDQIAADVAAVVEKYRAIFGWNVPDIDQKAADRMIVAEVREALDEVEKKLEPDTPLS